MCFLKSVIADRGRCSVSQINTSIKHHLSIFLVSRTLNENHSQPLYPNQSETGVHLVLLFVKG